MLSSVRKMRVITWSKSFQRGGVTGVRILNSKASGWVGTFTIVSRVPSIVCPEEEEEEVFTSFWQPGILVVHNHCNDAVSASVPDS